MASRAPPSDSWVDAPILRVAHGASGPSAASLGFRSLTELSKRHTVLLPLEKSLAVRVIGADIRDSQDIEFRLC
eukprot:3887982-Amphidinium_carterae.1